MAMRELPLKSKETAPTREHLRGLLLGQREAEQPRDPVRLVVRLDREVQNTSNVPRLRNHELVVLHSGFADELIPFLSLLN